MAQGRMLLKKISASKQVHELSSDLCRLAFTWTISHLDRDGRIYGSPAILKSMVFPRREDVTTEMMREFILEWAAAKLVSLYESSGDWYISFPEFRASQKGMHYEREAESVIPEKGTPVHAPDLLRTKSGPTPEEIKLKESKRSKSIEYNGEVRIDSGSAANAAIEKQHNDIPKPNPLYRLIQMAFLSKNDDKFTDYGKEGAAIKGLIKKAHARAPDEEEALLKDMLAHFWKLRTNGDKFWQSQPFLPSALNASGIWDRVLETMRNKEKMTDPVAMAVARGEIV